MTTQINSMTIDGGISLSQLLLQTIPNANWPVKYVADNLVFEDGAGAGQIDLVAAYAGTIAISGSLVVDLQALVGGFAQAVNMARLKVIYFQLLKNTVPDGGVLIGAAASNSLVTWQLPVRNTSLIDGLFELVLPDAVGIPVDATHKDFRIINQSASIVATYRLLLGGCSA